MRIRDFKIALIAFLLTLQGPAVSATEADSLRTESDSLRMESERFAWKQLVAPTVLFSAGAVGVKSEWFQTRINEPVRDYAARIRVDNGLSIEDYIQYAPGAAYLGLGFAVKPKHGFAERAIAAGTAWALSALLVQPLKYTVRELRPYGSTRNSFPSGHTATAFVGAELVRIEYGGWWGAGAYGFAVVTALMRVYHERHWVNDILGGAAIGILSAQAAYWLLPVERRLFGLENKDLSLLAVPYTDGHATGLSLSMRF
ncbi:MAG: phosphatase PAP2 family protein [Bacteroidales bacterium]|nr:phosphatase PAP2 family protein [Bacteroidales bacterium]